MRVRRRVRHKGKSEVFCFCEGTMVVGAIVWAKGIGSLDAALHRVDHICESSTWVFPGLSDLPFIGDSTVQTVQCARHSLSSAILFRG
jgi:hypothetical protein